MANGIWKRKKELPKAFEDAVSKEGVPFKKPIFGWNPQGVPVCNALIANIGGTRNPDGTKRCATTQRCNNGRCRKHGGVSLSGVNHPQHRLGMFTNAIRAEDTIDKLVEAAEDTTYLDLRTEFALNTVEIVTSLQNIKQGFDEKGWNEMMSIVASLEKAVFHKDAVEMVKYIDKTSGYDKIANLVERLMILTRAGANTSKVLEQTGKIIERRRRLVETEMKRSQLERNNMPAEEVLNLFLGIVNLVKDVFRAYPVELKIFGHEVDKMSVKANNRSALQARPGVSGIIEPKSGLTHGIDNITEAITVDGEYVEEPRLTKPFKRKIIAD